MNQHSKKISVFPSKKVIVITFLTLIGYLTYNFISKEDENFWQFNYAWDQLEVVHDFGSVQILDHSYDYIKFSKKGPVSLPKNEHVLKASVYKKNYYLCYSSFVQKKRSLKFVSGFWLTDQPPNNFKTAKIQIVDLPLIQNGTSTVDMIIDSQLMWHGGRNFRKSLAEKNSALKFVGQQKDMYGFPYTGGVTNTVEKTLRHQKELKKADIYLIQLGTHEPQSQEAQTLKNFKKLVGVLKQKNPQAMIYIILSPPSLNGEKNAAIKSLNAGLKQLQSNQVQIVDFYELMKAKGVKKYMTSDVVHYKKQAYNFLAERLNKLIDGA